MNENVITRIADLGPFHMAKDHKLKLIDNKKKRNKFDCFPATQQLTLANVLWLAVAIYRRNQPAGAIDKRAKGRKRQGL